MNEFNTLPINAAYSTGNKSDKSQINLSSFAYKASQRASHITPSPHLRRPSPPFHPHFPVSRFLLPWSNSVRTSWQTNKNANNCSYIDLSHLFAERGGLGRTKWSDAKKPFRCEIQYYLSNQWQRRQRHKQKRPTTAKMKPRHSLTSNANWSP